MPYIPIKSVGFIYFMRLPGFEPGLEAISLFLAFASKRLLGSPCHNRWTTAAQELIACKIIIQAI